MLYHFKCIVMLCAADYSGHHIWKKQYINEISSRVIVFDLGNRAHLDFGEELPKASSRVNLQALGQLQDELHHYGLMGHLFHQGMFLRKTTEKQLNF